MLRLTNNTFTNFDVQGSGKEATPYRVQSIGTDENLRWALGTYKNQTLRPQIIIDLDVDYGLTIEVKEKSAQGKAAFSAKLNVDRVLNTAYEAIKESIPTPGDYEKTGSILLAVALEAVKDRELDPDSYGLNKTAIPKALTIGAWKAAYLAIEDRYKLPARLRDEFIAIFKGLGHEIKFLSPTVEEKQKQVKQSKAVEIVSKADLTEGKLKTLRVAQLREVCKAFNVPTAGNKQALTERLIAIGEEFILTLQASQKPSNINGSAQTVTVNA